MSGDDETAVARQGDGIESADPGARNFALVSRILEIEQKRLDTRNEEIEAVKEAARLQDESDKRSFQYKMEELGVRKDDRHFGRRAFAFVAAAILLVVGFLFAVAFFGDDEKSQIALQIIGAMSYGVAGYGIIRVAEQALRQFLSRD